MDTATDIQICLDKVLSDAELDEARADLSIELNPANKPRALELAAVEKWLWPPGHTLRVSFLGAEPALHKRIEGFAEKPIMTSYTNFIQDFATRCRDLYCATLDSAKEDGKEVTLLLSIGMAAFVIPYERLNPFNEEHVADDRDIDAVDEVGRLERESFKGWLSGTSWQMIELLDGGKIRPPVTSWASPGDRKAVPDSKNRGSIMRIIRNALAHGAVFVYPEGQMNGPEHEIELLLFVAEHRVNRRKTGTYNVVVASPQDFEEFLMTWIEFLAELELKAETAPRSSA